VQFVRDNFMVGIKYNSLADLNGQALAWCNKVNGKVHATTDEVPFERLKKEGLSPLSRELIHEIHNRKTFEILEKTTAFLVKFFCVLTSA